MSETNKRMKILSKRACLVYAERPGQVDPNAPTYTNQRGDKVLAGVHEPRPEGSPTRQVWCMLCKRYFKTMRAFYDFHVPMKKKSAVGKKGKSKSVK